jgi:hypothetical protein
VNASPRLRGQPRLGPLQRGAERRERAARPPPHRHARQVDRRARAVPLHQLAREIQRGARRLRGGEAGEDGDVAPALLPRDEASPLADAAEHRLRLAVVIDHHDHRGLRPLPGRRRGERSHRGGGARLRGQRRADRRGELAAQRRHARRPLRGLLRQAAQHQILQRRREIHPRARAGRAEHPVPALDGAEIAGERQAQRQELVQDHAQRVDVGGGPRVAGRLELLGRHVLQRPQDRAALRERLLLGAAEPARQPEIEQRDPPPSLGQEDVLGLQIPVQEAPSVRDLERRGDRIGDPRRLGRGHRLRQLAEVPAERHAGEALHRDVRPPVVEPPLREEARRPRRADPPQGLGLAREALDHRRRAQPAGLDRRRRAVLLAHGGPHRREPSRADRLAHGEAGNGGRDVEPLGRRDRLLRLRPPVERARERRQPAGADRAPHDDGLSREDARSPRRGERGREAASFLCARATGWKPKRRRRSPAA